MEIEKNEGEHQPVEVTSGLKHGLGASAAALMPCGTAVTNVYEAYDAGVNAEKRRWIEQARMVRNRSNPEELFEAVPLAIMDCESA